MNYQIIARKYRPKNFTEVIGQEKIVTILQNALKKNRIGQAYLFSGPRGVGKTTTARILVKYLNCESQEKTIPCNHCRSCDEINRGISLDYLEIDGASNRGIDQIRALNEQLTFASPTGKYRVFVIDEVHMLTNEAFNALLKSLEEPPTKIIFILCTTESYRIPLTIQSRCQQLFFTNIDIHLTEKHLETILKRENIAFAPHSLFELAKKSEGSIRDAENLLEKVIAFSNEKEITSALIQEVLGETPTDKKYHFLSHISNQNLKESYQLINQLTADGYNLNEFFYNIVDILSNLVYYKSGIHDYKSLGITFEEVEHLKQFDKLFTLNEIFTLSDILFEFIHTLKNTTHRNTMVQYLLIKLHRYQQIITPGELKENILKLSKYTLPDENLNPAQKPEASQTEEKEEPIVVPITLSTKKSSSSKPTDSNSSSTSPPQQPKLNPEVTLSKEMLSDNSPPPSNKNPSGQESKKPNNPPNQKEQNPSQGVEWGEEEYKIFLQILKETDVNLFRMAAAFRFQNMKAGNLVLENRSNFNSERTEEFRKHFEEYLNLPSHKSHPLLKKLLSNSYQYFRVTIQESIVESNLKKIKKIFPLAE